MALDLLGERWTLLIVRELMLGPNRYSDLLGALDGVSTNLLADRLRHLESIGIVARRELPPPAASTVYELTPQGLELEGVVLQLAKWGQSFTSPSPTFEPRSALFALRTSFLEAPAIDAEPCVINLQVDGHTMSVGVDRGRFLANPHPAEMPSASVMMDSATLQDLLDGHLGYSQAASSAQVQSTGDESAIRRVLESLGIS